MALKHVNAIVVGAGAGGGIVAKQLSEAGLSVVLFERGKWHNYDDVDNDELNSQREAVFACPYGPDNKHPRVVEDINGNCKTVLPNGEGYGNNAACVGGGTLSYGAMAWRYMPQDFRMRSTCGHVEGSTLEDWPISYDDLEPYYEKAEWEIGIAGDDTSNPYAPPRRKNYPMPAFEYNLEARILEPAAKRLGYHPFPLPMLRNSVAYGGRPACIRHRTCVGFACPLNAKGGSQNTVIPIALKTGNCELRTESMVCEIILDERGRARGVYYFDRKDKKHRQTSDIVVLAGGAIETARLLLNSKSKLFPNGAGNNNDWVGRNLQGHAYPSAYGLFEQITFDDVGAGATIGICDFNHDNEGIIGGGMLANEFIRLPYKFSRKRPPDEPTWGKAHKDYQRKYYKRHIRITGPVHEMSVFDARVTADPSVKDHWGIPVVHLSGHRHPNDIEVGRFLASKAEAWLKEADAIKTWTTIPKLRLSGGQHQAGTCRMGNDPKTSVTNKFGQLHQIDNIFVADGGVHVTNGGFNPALTIMAIGYWVSDYIKNQWKNTKFRS